MGYNAHFPVTGHSKRIYIHRSLIGAKQFLIQLVRAVRGMADVDLRHDAGLGRVTGAQ
jgi:hypothetical protein